MNKQDKQELARIKADTLQDHLQDEQARKEEQRIVWAQRNGNDSGFDPYADIQD